MSNATVTYDHINKELITKFRIENISETIETGRLHRFDHWQRKEENERIKSVKYFAWEGIVLVVRILNFKRKKITKLSYFLQNLVAKFQI